MSAILGATGNNINVATIPTDSILVDHEFNCRGEISPTDCVDLAQDIERQGLMQPIVVSLFSEEDKKKYNKTYRLLAGFRRWVAVSKVLKRDIILALIRKEELSETDARILNLAENLKRKELNIVQEAKAIENLYRLGLSEALVSERLGMPRGWVQIRFMLLKLPTDIQSEVRAGTVNQSEIRQLYTIHKTGNRVALEEAVRGIKDAKIRGVDKPRNVLPMEMRKQQKKIASKQEQEEMLIYLANIGLSGFATKCLAWASGNITLDQFFDAIKTEKAAKGEDWSVPTNEQFKELSKS